VRPALEGSRGFVSSAEKVGRASASAVTACCSPRLGNLARSSSSWCSRSKGETVVAQTSLSARCLANGLLVSHRARCGGRQFSQDGVHAAAAQVSLRDTATLLLLASRYRHLGFARSGAQGEPPVKVISDIGEGASWRSTWQWVIPYVTLGRRQLQGQARVAAAVRGHAAGGGRGPAFVSDWFISALDPRSSRSGISKAVAGLVIVAIAGKREGNAAGIVLRAQRQGRPRDQLSKRNSVEQVAAVPVPAACARVALVRHAAHVRLSAVTSGDLPHRDPDSALVSGDARRRR